MNQKEEIRMRVKQFVDNQQFGQNVLASKLGMAQSTLSRQLNGKSEFGSQIIYAILELFPNLSAEWLLRGTGSMLLTDGQSATNVVNGNNNITASPNSQVNVGGSKATDGATEWVVPNGAMAPEFAVGDRLALQVQESAHIINGNAYVLKTKMGMLLRYVYEDKSQYVCKATDGRFTDTVVNKSDVLCIYTIGGMYRVL